MSNILPVIIRIFNYMDSIIQTLREHASLNVGSIRTSYIDVVFVLILIGFVVTLYWKGAKA